MLQIINKTIEYGLYFLVFLLPVQTRWIIKPAASEYLTVSLYGTDIILVLLLFLFVIFNTFFCHSRPLRQSSSEASESGNPPAAHPWLRTASAGKRATGQAGGNQTNVNFYANDLMSAKLRTSPGFPIACGFGNDKKKMIFLSPEKFKEPFFLIAGLMLIAFISVFFAPDKLIAIQSCLRLLLGIGLFWLIVSANYNKLKLILSFLAGIFLQACLGIWQFLTQSAFANKWLGMAAHNASDLGVSVVETLQGERWLRAYGGLDHPNMLGGLLVVGILMLIGNENFLPAFKPGSGGFSRLLARLKPREPELKLGRIIFIFYFLLLLTALFFTFSRGAWAGLIIGILVTLAAMVIKKDLRGQKRLLKIILLSAALIFILFSQFQNLVLTRLSQDTRLEVKSNNERVESLRESWEVIRGNWLLGVGVGNYIAGIRELESTRLKHREPELKLGRTSGDMPAWYYQPAHNVFLLVWAELGIFGLLFFILIPLFIIPRPRAAQRGRHYSLFKNNLRSKNLILSISLLAAILVMFLVDHWWWSLHFGILLFWLILGLIFAIDNDNNKTYNDNIIQ